MEERDLAMGPRPVGQVSGQATPEPHAAPLRIDADRAELDMALQPKPFARHRHETAVAPNPDIVAEQHRTPA